MTAVLSEKKASQIEDEALKVDISKAALYLQKNLGQKITAYLSGLKDIKEVGVWASGKSTPTQDKVTRLRYAYQATRMIVESYGPDTAKAWFFGSNMRLADRAPAYVLRHSDGIEDLQALIPVAKAFAGAVD